MSDMLRNAIWDAAAREPAVTADMATTITARIMALLPKAGQPLPQKAWVLMRRDSSDPVIRIYLNEDDKLEDEELLGEVYASGVYFVEAQVFRRGE